MSPIQMPLAVNFRDQNGFNNYIPGENIAVTQALQSLASNHEDNEQFIYIWGKPGAGKSHLLQACCHEVNTHSQRSAYLPLKNQTAIHPAMLENLEHVNLVCIDDIDSVLTNPTWEEALFHFFNAIKEANNRLLISANGPPQQLNCKLADLQSRLCWGLTLQVKLLSDEQKAQAIQHRARLRGLELNDDVTQFIINHCARDTHTLFNILDKLDEASLIEKRRITIPFLKKIILDN